MLNVTSGFGRIAIYPICARVLIAHLFSDSNHPVCTNLDVILMFLTEKNTLAHRLLDLLDSRTEALGFIFVWYQNKANIPSRQVISAISLFASRTVVTHL